MLELEHKMEEVDPIHWKPIRYHKHEWDNIPPVVPKFIINLSKYVRGLCELAKVAHESENVQGLRDWIENQLKVKFPCLIPFAELARHD